MSVKLKACDECALLCHVMHTRNRDASPMASSFFKFLFGFNFNDFLRLPPSFASRRQHLIGQEAQLEDSYGEQWTVTISKVEDSLAFKEGWKAFSEDHRLEMGEILVFHQINLSNQVHFLVQVYGVSGCQVFRRVNNENSNKRSRTNGDCGAKAGPSRVNDNRFGSNALVDFDSNIQALQVVPRRKQFEEPSCMIERDDGHFKGEYSSCLYDLSKYETPPGAKKFSHRVSTELELEMVNDSSVNPYGHLLDTFIEKQADNTKRSSAMRKEEVVFQKPEKPSSTHPRTEEKSIECSDINDKYATFGGVKDEPNNFDDNDTPLRENSSSPCLVVIQSINYLELPADFPSILSTRSIVDRKVILIRGVDTRLWAVMYIQKYGIKILNSGWKAFCKSNKVQPEDECHFQLERNNLDCVFKFNIVNRQVNAPSQHGGAAE